MGNLVLLGAQFKREFIYLKRYFFNFLGGFVTLYVVFLLIFFGFRGIAGGTEMYGAGLGNLIVGYVTWVLAMMIYQDVSYNLFNEAREGILEQLYMSPFGYVRVTSFRLIAGLVIHLSMSVVILLAMMLSTGRYLNLDLISLVPLVAMLLIPVAGLGFILGGLQLLYKRIQSILQVVQFLLVGVVAAPIGLGWTQFLPGTLASHLVREVMVNEISFTSLPGNQSLLALGIALFYALLGIGVFRFCERRAMISGRLGQF